VISARTSPQHQAPHRNPVLPWSPYRRSLPVRVSAPTPTLAPAKAAQGNRSGKKKRLNKCEDSDRRRLARPQVKARRFKKREPEERFIWARLPPGVSTTPSSHHRPDRNTLSWKSRFAASAAPAREPVSAQQAAVVRNAARDHGLRSVDVRVSGPGSGRESAIRALATTVSKSAASGTLRHAA